MNVTLRWDNDKLQNLEKVEALFALNLSEKS